MKEDFLSFIWQYQYFEKTHLVTCNDEALQIFDPGQVNYDSGPDFANARLRIGSTNWVGTVEIHTLSSDWYAHKHHLDQAFDNVVLHVVYKNNSTTKNTQKRDIPVLELKGKIARDLLLAQKKLRISNTRIPCMSQTRQISKSVFNAMINRVAEQRLARKSQQILLLLKRHKFDWDQVAYLTTGKNFGFHINTSPFELLVNLVPLSIVRRIGADIVQLESLFFGQAGFLERIHGDSYYLMLQNRYEYLKRKYSFDSRYLKKKMWKYLRMRPSNFPALRIAQFVTYLQQTDCRFSNIREMKTAGPFMDIVVCPSPYWQEHYDFRKKSIREVGCLGKSSKENLLINTVAPLLDAYGHYTGQVEYVERAMMILKQIPAEQNVISSHWKDKGFRVSSAYYSQGLVGLNNEYCKLNRCLNCMIGQSLITGNTIG